MENWWTYEQLFQREAIKYFGEACRWRSLLVFRPMPSIFRFTSQSNCVMEEVTTNISFRLYSHAFFLLQMYSQQVSFILTACKCLCNWRSTRFHSAWWSHDTTRRSQATHAARSLLQTHGCIASSCSNGRSPCTLLFVLYNHSYECSQCGCIGGDERLDEEYSQPVGKTKLLSLPGEWSSCRSIVWLCDLSFGCNQNSYSNSECWGCCWQHHKGDAKVYRLLADFEITCGRDWMGRNER